MRITDLLAELDEVEWRLRRGSGRQRPELLLERAHVKMRLRDLHDGTADLPAEGLIVQWPARRTQEGFRWELSMVADIHIARGLAGRAQRDG